MAQYSFLSGSTIDNYSRSFYDYFKNGNIYLGFSRGTPDYQWGSLALINVEAQYLSGGNWYSTNNAASAFETPAGSAPGIFHDNLPVTGSGNQAYIHFNGATSAINIIEGNESWLLVKNLPPDYYTSLNTNNPTLAANGAHIYTSTNSNVSTRRFKILTKGIDSIPSYTVDCDLYYYDNNDNNNLKRITGSQYPTLQRTINVLGESIITGLIDNAYSDLNNINFMSSHKFALLDASNNTILDNLNWISTSSNSTFTIITSINGSTEKYLTFAVTSSTGYTQYIKVAVGSNQINEFAIWHENIPFSTSIPIADSNPPALDVSYLRTPLIEKSIFNINGMYKINGSNIKYVREMLSTADYDKFNKLNNSNISVTALALSGDLISHYGVIKTAVNANAKSIVFESQNFVQGDIIYLPMNPSIPNNNLLSYNVTSVDYANNTIYLDSEVQVNTSLPAGLTISSSASPVNAVINYAYTTDEKTALRYGLNSIMIDISIPTTGSPAEYIYDSLYRQIFLCSNPLDKTGSLATSASYNESNYNPTTHTSDIGTLLYVSNRIPIYRRQINADTENFTLIL